MGVELVERNVEDFITDAATVTIWLTGPQEVIDELVASSAPLHRLDLLIDAKPEGLATLTAPVPTGEDQERLLRLITEALGERARSYFVSDRDKSQWYVVVE